VTVRAPADVSKPSMTDLPTGAVPIAAKDGAWPVLSGVRVAGKGPNDAPFLFLAAADRFRLGFARVGLARLA
jgi:hypothetical protein